MTPKNLIIAMIEREREIYRIMTGLETVGMTINVFGARSDLVLLACAVCGRFRRGKRFISKSEFAELTKPVRESAEVNHVEETRL